MKPTYLFYDIETTGLNKCFDQVLQFAAIRTDTALKEIDRTQLHVRLNPDVVPSPDAILTHGIGITDSLTGENEFDAITQIHALMNQPGTISLGYNTLGFDDEFLRFSFYRNLLPPYTHQYASGCGRQDLYPMAIMYYLYKNDIIQWPMVNNRPSMKLEYLSDINQLATGKAHNAMVDVEATLALAKRLKEEKPMWDYLGAYFDKNTDVTRMTKLTPAFENNHYYHRQALYINGRLGPDNDYQCPVLSLGTHNHYKNQSLWLRLDTDELEKTTQETIPETTWVIHKKNGEPGFLLPTSERFMAHMNDTRTKHLQKNIDWLQKNPEKLDAIIAYHKDYTYPIIPNIDIDAALYQNGFLSQAEQHACQLFHAAPLDQKAKRLDQLTNPNLREQALRILGRHYPDLLSDTDKNTFSDYLQAINTQENPPRDYRGEPRFTPTQARAIIKDRLDEGTLDEEHIALMTDLRHYLDQQFPPA